MTTPWWAAFGPAEAVVSCGAEKHRLRWADGTLQAADHADAEGELVLAALGGDVSPCLELVRMWGQHSDDLAVLAIGPRSAGDQLTLTTAALDELTADNRRSPWATVAALRARRGSVVISWPASSAWTARGGWHRVTRRSARFSGSAAVSIGGTLSRPVSRVRSGLVTGWSGPPGGRRFVHGMMPAGGEGDRVRTDALRLLALGPPFQWRLSGGVAHAWSDEGQQANRRGRAGPALAAALAGRLAPAAARWLDIEPGQVSASIHDGDGWGRIGWARPATERRLVASLPVSWLARVWAPGLAVVSGQLVIGVQDAAYPAARVLALRAPDREPAELTIRHDGRHWSVTA